MEYGVSGHSGSWGDSRVLVFAAAQAGRANRLGSTAELFPFRNIRFVNFETKTVAAPQRHPHGNTLLGTWYGLTTLARCGTPTWSVLVVVVILGGGPHGPVHAAIVRHNTWQERETHHLTALAAVECHLTAPKPCLQVAASQSPNAVLDEEAEHPKVALESNEGGAGGGEDWDERW